MNEERYHELENNADYTIFMFVSIGRNGALLKIVNFDKVDELSDTYNLALGTMNDTGEVDYNSVSNNGDRNKILATIAQIVIIFFRYHPGKNIYITGSDYRRTMLYQRAIHYAYDELIQLFNIYGETSFGKDDYELFDKNKNYSGFVINRKV